MKILETKKHGASIAFILISLFIALTCVLLELIPEHRYKDGDWGILLNMQIYPILFIIHGIISGFFLIAKFSKKVYCITTALIIFLPLFVCSLLAYNIMKIDYLLLEFARNMVRSIVFVLCSMFGVCIIFCSNTIWRKVYKFHK